MYSTIHPQQLQSQPQILTKVKKIHKNGKKGKKICRKRPANGCGHHQLKNAGSKYKVQSSKYCEKRPDYWLNNVNQWFVNDPMKASQCIDEQISQMPILDSVQQLFSLSTKRRFTTQINQNHFNRYCRVVSFSDDVQTQNILFKGQEVQGVCHVATNRSGAKAVNSVLLVSPEESQVIQKRVSFMEKLKENELKYDASITKMSYISKELAFNYRMYLQKRTELCDYLSKYSAVEEQTFENPQAQYLRLLLKKNLSHAFLRTKVEPINYFKFKQACQSNRTNLYEHLSTIQQLKQFIQRRKPKKVKKSVLATACSICLSDYYEANNPFKHCYYCGMRAHQLCFSFEHSKCGFCSYQKIQRHLKEQISWCFICKQEGFLTVKFNDREYAHGFCLLAHGLWKINNPSRSSYPSLQSSERISFNSSGSLLQSKFRNNSKSIQFINPQQSNNLTQTSMPLIPQAVFEQNEPRSIDVQSSQNPSLRDIGVRQESQQMNGWRNHSSQDTNNCACCRETLYKAYYLTCETCGKVFHALCAFLSGFDLRLNQNKWYSNAQNYIQLNCCCQQAHLIAWSRKYKLNYKRIAFDIENTRRCIEDAASKMDESGLLFHY